MLSKKEMNDLPDGFIEGRIVGHTIFIVVMLTFCVLLFLI